MKVKQIRLNNFLRYKHLDLDLMTLGDVIGIVGPNGSGKTSLVEAISYVLFGEGRVSDKKLINKYTDEESFSVEVSFDFEGKELFVVRGNGLRGAFGEVHFDGVKRVSNYSGITKFVERLLGLTPKVFFSSVFCRQGGFNNFTRGGVGPAERKQIFSEILDLDVFSLVEKRVNNAVKLLDTEMQSFTFMINQVKTELNQLKGESPQERRKELEGKLSELEVREKNLSEELSELLTTKEQFLQKEAKINSLKSLENLVSVLENEVLSLDSKIKEIRGELKIKQQEFLDVMSRASTTEETPVLNLSELNSLQESVSKLEARIEEIELRIPLLEKEDSVCPVCLRELGEKLRKELYEKFTSERDSLRREKDNLLKRLEQVRNAVDEIREKIQQKQIEKKTLQEKSTFLKETVDRLQKDLRDYEESLREKRKMLLEKEKELKPLQEEFENFDPVVIENLNRRIISLETAKETIKKEKEGILTSLERIKIKEERLRELEKQLLVFESRLQNEYMKQMEVLKIIKKIFSRDGIPTAIMNEALDEVEERCNFVLQKILSEFSLRFDTYVETQGGSIKEGLWIFVDDSVSENDYNALSGGEKDIIDIAINLGVSHLVRTRSRSLFDIIFLDEVFRHLDDINTEKLVELINSLKEEFSQIFVISHRPFVQGVFPTLLRTSRQGAFSRIDIL